MCCIRINEENESEIVVTIYGNTTGAGASPMMLVAAPR